MKEMSSWRARKGEKGKQKSLVKLKREKKEEVQGGEEEIKYTVFPPKKCVFDYVCFFKGIFNTLRPLPRQHWAAIGWTENGRPKRVTNA